MAREQFIDLLPVRVDRARAPHVLPPDVARRLENCDLSWFRGQLRRGAGHARYNVAALSYTARNCFQARARDGRALLLVGDTNGQVQATAGSTAEGPGAAWLDSFAAEDPVFAEDAGWGGSGDAVRDAGWSQYSGLLGSGAVARGDPALVLEAPLSVPLTGCGLVMADCDVTIEGTGGFDKGTATLEVFDSLNGWITLGVYVYEPCWNRCSCAKTPWIAGGTFLSTLTKYRWTLENNAGMVFGDLITFTCSGVLYAARGAAV